MAPFFNLVRSTSWHSHILYPMGHHGLPLFERIKPEGYKKPMTDNLKLVLGMGKYGRAWHLN